jgi:hypothetical protein
MMGLCSEPTPPTIKKGAGFDEAGARVAVLGGRL